MSRWPEFDASDPASASAWFAARVETTRSMHGEPFIWSEATRLALCEVARWPDAAEAVASSDPAALLDAAAAAAERNVRQAEALAEHRSGYDAAGPADLAPLILAGMLTEAGRHVAVAAAEPAVVAAAVDADMARIRAAGTLAAIDAVIRDYWQILDGADADVDEHAWGRIDAVTLGIAEAASSILHDAAAAAGEAAGLGEFAGEALHFADWLDWPAWAAAGCSEAALIADMAQRVTAETRS